MPLYRLTHKGSKEPEKSSAGRVSRENVGHGLFDNDAIRAVI